MPSNVGLNAKNYLLNEPKLPNPQIDPFKVADAILDAATSPTHDIKVGAMSKLNTAMEQLMPSLAEKMSAKQADNQQYAEPPRNPDGAAYRPSRGGRIHGTGGVTEEKAETV